MAGTLQTLILSPATSATVRLRPRNARFSSHGDRLSVRPVNIGPHRSISPPIRASGASPGQVGGNDYAPKIPGKVKAGNPFSKFVADNFLPLALIGGVALGLAYPTPGCLADRYYLSKFSTFGIFIISGLTLRSGEIGAAAEAWPVGMFGLV